MCSATETRSMPLTGITDSIPGREYALHHYERSFEFNPFTFMSEISGHASLGSGSVYDLAPHGPIKITLRTPSVLRKIKTGLNCLDCDEDFFTRNLANVLIAELKR